jgi:hypothetical protein
MRQKTHTSSQEKGSSPAGSTSLDATASQCSTSTQTTQSPAEERLLTSSAVAARYRVDSRTVAAWIREGSIRGIRVNGRWRVTYDEILRIEGWPPGLHAAWRQTAITSPPYSVDALAYRWSCCAETVRRRLRRATPPPFQLGHRLYVRADMLAAYENSLRQSATYSGTDRKVA